MLALHSNEDKTGRQVSHHYSALFGHLSSTEQDLARMCSCLSPRPAHAPWRRLGCHKMVSAHLPKRPFFLAGAAFLTAFFATFFTGAFFATTFFATFFTGFGFGFATGLGRALGAGGSTIEPLTGPGKNMATSDERTADRETRDTGALKAELRNDKRTWLAQRDGPWRKRAWQGARGCVTRASGEAAG